MPIRLRLVLGTAAWAAATLGVLAMERLPGHYEERFCGAWG
jgi:hypothetical protein